MKNNNSNAQVSFNAVPYAWALGYMDIANNIAFRDEYDNWHEQDQSNYEIGRMTATQIKASGGLLEPLYLGDGPNSVVHVQLSLLMAAQIYGATNRALVNPQPEDALLPDPELEFRNVMQDLKRITPKRKRK